MLSGGCHGSNTSSTRFCAASVLAVRPAGPLASGGDVLDRDLAIVSLGRS
jgi:hypothetical protein